MYDLPDNIRAIQEKFRPRFEAHDARMASQSAAALATELANAEVVDDLPMGEGLVLLAAFAKGNS